MLGALVHNTESSLACPDWPLCYGQVFPVMEGGILIEHSHRLLATLVGFLCILQVYVSTKYWKANPNPEALHLRHWSWGLLGLVILQGLLGGLTVIYKLPTIVSTSHLTLSLIFFCSLIYVHHHQSLLSTKPSFKIFNLSDEEKQIFGLRWNSFYRHLLLLSGVLLFCQIIPGPFMRHSGAGVACGVGFQNSLLCMDISLWKRVLFPQVPAAMLHMAHRLFALLVFSVIAYGSYHLWNLFRGIKKLQVLSLLPVLFCSFQVVVGVLTVAYHIQVVPTTLHLFGAVVTLVSIWKLALILKSLESRHSTTSPHSFLSDVVNLTKPKLSGLVMMTVLVGIYLAPSHVNFFKGLWAFILIFFSAIGATTLNCYLEKDVDEKMIRTRDRALPSGRFSPQIALGLGVVFVSFSFFMLHFTINEITAILSLISVLLYLYVYTPMKQKSQNAVYVGAIPGALPPVLGLTAVTGEIDAMAIILFLIVFVWQLPHFLAISIYHADDYRSANIQVYPNQLGVKITKNLIFGYTIVLLLLSLSPIQYFKVSGAYSLTALVLGLSFVVLSTGGYWVKNIHRVKDWAKFYFYGSIIYLPLLFGALIFFK